MRMHIATLLLVSPLAAAQASFPTDFPDGAQPLAPEALKERIAGKVFVTKPAAGNELRVQYDENYAFINVGRNSDSGKWRIEGSSICYAWQKFPQGCSEVRTVGDVLYIKRYSNGEVATMEPK